MRVNEVIGPRLLCLIKIYFQATCFLLLPLRELVNLYLHIICAACLSLSVFSAYHFAEEEISQAGARKFGSGYIKHHVSDLMLLQENEIHL